MRMLPLLSLFTSNSADRFRLHPFLWIEINRVMRFNFLSFQGKSLEEIKYVYGAIVYSGNFIDGGHKDGSQQPVIPLPYGRLPIFPA